MESTIEGVAFKDLVTNTDERGLFRELIRSTDEFFSEGFAQWSQSVMFYGVTKAWHLHRQQIDWWYVATGVLRIGLADTRPDSPSFKRTMDFMMGDLQPARILRIPPGVAHGCKVIQGPATLFYITSRIYDPDDELRIPYDTPEIDFDWLKGPVIK